MYIYIYQKERGLSTDLWDTPDLTGSQEEVCPFSNTLW